MSQFKTNYQKIEEEVKAIEGKISNNNLPEEATPFVHCSLNLIRDEAKKGRFSDATNHLENLKAYCGTYVK